MKLIMMFVVFDSLVGVSLSAAPIAGSLPTVPAAANSEAGQSMVFNRAWPDTFSSYVYTFGNIIPFSYEDSTELVLKDMTGAFVWQGTLRADARKVILTQPGTFFIQGNKRYSVLTGDAISAGCTGYFALDQYSLPLSRKFLTFQPLRFVTPGWQSDETFIVFSYEDSTSVAIRDLDLNMVIWQGTLNKSEHHSFYPGHIFLSVTANHPVSALSYADQDFYIPAKEGSFVGTLFYTWVGRVGSNGGWQNDLNIFPWQDNTNITVTNTQTGATIWQGRLNEGDVHTVLTSHVYVTIQSDKPISAVITPFVSFTQNYFHMQCCSDSSGSGLGKKFYVCALANGTAFEDYICVQAFRDSTEVAITDTRSGTVDWSGTLDQGQYYKHRTKNTFYRVTATEPIAVYEAGEQADFVIAGGSKFAPLWFNLPPVVTVPEDKAPVAVPSLDDLQTDPNPFSRTTTVRFSLSVAATVSLQLFDASGRLMTNLIDNQRFSAGNHHYEWDGSDRHGHRVAAGLYFYLLAIDKGDKKHNNETIITKKVIKLP